MLAWIKNDVHFHLEEAQRIRKEQMAKLKREALETGQAMKDVNIKRGEEDGGMLKMKGLLHKNAFPLKSNEIETKTRAKFHLIDTLYNSLRSSLKEVQILNLRYDYKNPEQPVRSG